MESKYSRLSGRIGKTLSSSVRIERATHLPFWAGRASGKAFDMGVGCISVDLRDLSTLAGFNRDLNIRISRSCYSAILEVMRTRGLLEMRVLPGSVTALYSVKDRADYGPLLVIAASVASAIRLLGTRYTEKNLNTLSAGIGVSVSRGLRMSYRRPGGCRGSVWSAPCIHEAEDLSRLGGTLEGADRINTVVITQDLYDFQRTIGLPEGVQVTRPFSKVGSGYHGDIGDRGLDSWIQEHFPN